MKRLPSWMLHIILKLLQARRWTLKVAKQITAVEGELAARIVDARTKDGRRTAVTRIEVNFSGYGAGEISKRIKARETALLPRASVRFRTSDRSN